MRALQLHASPAVPLQRHHNKPDPNQILTTTPHSATNCALTVRATTRADAQAHTRRHTARCVYPHAPHRTPHTSQHILHTLRFTTDRAHTPLRTTTASHVTTMAASSFLRAALVSALPLRVSSSAHSLSLSHTHTHHTNFLLCSVFILTKVL